jgi:hypothetical protein
VKAIEEPSPQAAAPSSTSYDVLQEKGVMKMDVSTLVPYQAVVTEEGMVVAGALMQLLCRIWRDGNGGMSVVPCTDDEVAAGSENEVFWCCVQPQEDGNVAITPCTLETLSDPSACGICVDASGAPLEAISDTVGAPARPAAGSYVPAWVYGAQWPSNVAPTTVILSNLPENLMQDDFFEILDKDGYSGFYDFAYLPMDSDSKCTVGYAIVNLTRHEYGLALAAAMHGRTSWCGDSTKECQVTWSMTLQGTDQLLKHYRNDPACSGSVPSDMRPTFFSGGWPRPFPAEKS